MINGGDFPLASDRPANTKHNKNNIDLWSRLKLYWNFKASSISVNRLPPALIINGENDVLRDKGEAYTLKVSEAGVPVSAVRYHGTIHDFVMLNVITDDPARRGAIEQASIMLKNALSG